MGTIGLHAIQLGHWRGKWATARWKEAWHSDNWQERWSVSAATKWTIGFHSRRKLKAVKLKSHIWHAHSKPCPRVSSEQSTPTGNFAVLPACSLLWENDSLPLAKFKHKECGLKGTFAYVPVKSKASSQVGNSSPLVTWPRKTLQVGEHAPFPMTLAQGVCVESAGWGKIFSSLELPT